MLRVVITSEAMAPGRVVTVETPTDPVVDEVKPATEVEVDGVPATEVVVDAGG